MVAHTATAATPADHVSRLLHDTDEDFLAFFDEDGPVAAEPEPADGGGGLERARVGPNLVEMGSVGPTRMEQNAK
jgi:hypothetical protein